MGFENSILAGTKLVRESIQSPNYVTGVSGWTINKDGSAEFSDIIVRGDLQSSNYVAGVSGYFLDWSTGSVELNDLTARGTVQSSNFSTGVSGWQVNDAGTAEFNDLTARGSIRTEDTGQRVELTDSGGFSEVRCYSGDAQEILPGTVSSFSTTYGAVTQSVFQLFSNVDEATNKAVNITLVPPFTGSPTPNGAIFVGGTLSSGVYFIMNPETNLHSQNTNIFGLTDNGNHPMQIGLDGSENLRIDAFGMQAVNNAAVSEMYMQPLGGTLYVGDVGVAATLLIPNTNDVSVSSTNNALITGDLAGDNLAFDGNEIMARNNGAAATLNLQNNGGLVQIGSPIQCGDMRGSDDSASGNVTTTSGTLVTDNTNGPNYNFGDYPPGGAVLVIISADMDNSGAASFSAMTFRIRDTNSSGTVRFTGGSNETIRHQGSGARSTCSTATVVTGLPSSGTGFIEGLYSSTGGNTATFRNADIVVIPMT